MNHGPFSIAGPWPASLLAAILTAGAFSSTAGANEPAPPAKVTDPEAEAVPEAAPPVAPVPVPAPATAAPDAPVPAGDPPAAPAEAPTTPPRPVPATASAALDQAAAAYEYGDMNLVVESARLVVDGGMTSSEAERADALRFLGIGLYLTGRVEGARVAFAELLRLRPDARLDAAITRPEVVAFFGEQKRAHARKLQQDRRRDRQARQSHIAWNLLPPVGQFNNGDGLRGWIVLSAEVLTLGTAITTSAILNAWHNSDDTVCPAGQTACDRVDTARTLRSLNHLSVGLFAVSYAAAVIDGFLRHGRAIDEAAPEPWFAVTVLPNGVFLGGKF